MNSLEESEYPTTPAERDRWIRERRGPRPALDITRPYAVFWEDEPATAGGVARVLTALMTSRECPWRCVMCDLWQRTVEDVIPAGAVPGQIAFALNSAGEAAGNVPRELRWAKLFNSGSFFDPLAVPPTDYRVIARLLTGFGRVIVECHPTLVGRRVTEFQAALQAASNEAGLTSPTLEVAMGLETVHPQVLPKLNKRMTLDHFWQASDFLTSRGIALRVFLLVHPPFMVASEAADWAQFSADYAFKCGARVVCLVPTRLGNGALESLLAAGQFTAPDLHTFETVFERSLRGSRGRVLGDVWDLEQLARCPSCREARIDRIRQMNLQQRELPRVECAACSPGPGET